MGDVMELNSLASIVGFLLVTSLTICSFFMRSMIKRMEDGNKTLANLDKNMAVLIARIDQYDDRLKTLESNIGKLAGENSDLRMRLLALSDDLSKIRWKVSAMKCGTNCTDDISN